MDGAGDPDGEPGDPVGEGIPRERTGIPCEGGPSRGPEGSESDVPGCAGGAVQDRDHDQRDRGRLDRDRHAALAAGSPVVWGERRKRVRRR